MGLVLIPSKILTKWLLSSDVPHSLAKLFQRSLSGFYILKDIEHPARRDEVVHSSPRLGVLPVATGLQPRVEHLCR